MNYKPSALISLLSLAAVILGGLLGYFLPDLMLSIEFIGLLFINGLKFLVLPLIAAIIITGITALADSGKLNRSLGKLFLYFGASSLVAILIGLLSALAIQPGYLSNKTGAFIPSTITDLNELSFSKTIAELIPDNFALATSESQVIGLIIFSILIGGALISIAKNGKTVNDFFEGVKAITSRITGLFIWIAPFGLFSLVGASFARNYHTESIYTNLASFSITFVLAILIHFLVILPIALKLMGKQSPLSFYKNLLPAFATAFGTGSSVATLPVTSECMAEGSDVDQRASSLALPLGSIFNLNGTAIYLIIGAIFIAQLYGQELTILSVLVLVFTTLLVSLGGSIIPNSSLLLLAAVLSIAGFPAQAFAGLGLLLAIDWLFDRLKVVVNVASDAVGAAVLGETFDFKTATRAKTTSRLAYDVKSKTTSSRYQKKDKPSRATSKTRTKDSRTDKTEKPAERRKRTNVDKPATPTVKKKVERKESPSPRTVANKTSRTTKFEADKKATKERVDKKPKSTFDITKPPAIPKAPAILKPPVKQKVDIVEEKSDNKAIANDPKFNNDTIERERARISAHLEALKQKEKNKNYLSPQKDEPTKEAIPETIKVEMTPETLPKVDYTDETQITKVDTKSAEKVDPSITPEPEKVEKTMEEPLKETNAPDPVVKEEPAKATITDEKPEATEPVKPAKPIVYGRSKPKRPVVKKAEPTSDEDEKEAEPAAELSSKEITFGRSKRKK